MTEIINKVPNKKYSTELKIFSFRINQENKSLFTTTLLKLLNSKLSDNW